MKSKKTLLIFQKLKKINDHSKKKKKHNNKQTDTEKKNQRKVSQLFFSYRLVPLGLRDSPEIVFNCPFRFD